MAEALFINCLPENLARFEPLSLRLQQAGITWYIPPPITSPQVQQEVVEKIRQIALSGGGMLCLLSRQALDTPAFISNIQWMCENARNRKALIFYPLDPRMDTRAIRLFAPQAVQVKPHSRPAADIASMARAIHAVLHPRPAGLFAFLTGQFSKRLLLRLFIATLLVGIGAVLLYPFFQTLTSGPSSPTPTPVVMLMPFSGQSAPAGLTVDPGQPPDYPPVGDPADEAPFTFNPAVVLDRETFRDLAFDGDFDRRAWMVSDNRLEGLPGVYVRQRNNLLYEQLVPSEGRQASAGLIGTYLFNLQQLSYLGIRFRLNPYEGTVRDGTFLIGRIQCQFLDHPEVDLASWNGLDQGLDGFSEPLGTKWHVLEMRRLPNQAQVEVTLDGKKFRQLSFDPGLLSRWMRLAISLFGSNTDQWAGVQLDEVVYGADAPVASRLETTGADYHYTPDSVLLHQDFNAPLSPEFIQAGSEFVRQSPGAAEIVVPAGQGSTGTMLRFPTRPISEANYYAIRFRFTSEEGNPWNAWTSFHMKIVEPGTKWDDKFDVSYGFFPQSATFGISFGIWNGLPQYPFGQSLGKPLWHTLEMVIQPPAQAADRYIGWFWADGALLGQVEMRDDPSRLLDPRAAYILNINLSGEGDRNAPLSVEVDDLIIGTMSPEHISE